MPTLSGFPPIRTNAVLVVVVVVVDVARRRNAKIYNTQPMFYYFLSLLLHAIAINFTSETILDQNAAELSASKFKFIDNSM